MSALRDRLTSSRLRHRVMAAAAMTFVLFHTAVIVSYLLLPEGALRGRQPLQGWQESPEPALLAVQIFCFNLVSVLLIALASLFARARPGRSGYLSVGYLVFFVLVGVNGVVLGTWSFSSAGAPVPLPERLLGTFDLVHRAGLWEMAGQLLISCALAHSWLVRTVSAPRSARQRTDRQTTTRRLREIRPPRAERLAVGAGLLLMALGAVIESHAITAPG